MTTKSKLKHALVCVLTVGIACPALGASIYGPASTESHFIKTSSLQNGNARFELCEIVDTQKCDVIGSADGYTKAEVKTLRGKLKGQALLIGVADAAIVVASTAGLAVGVYYLGAWAALASAKTAVAKTVGVFMYGGVGLGVGAVSGIVGSSWLIKKIKALNPQTRWRKANTLFGDEAISTNVKIDVNMSIDNLARELESKLIELR